MPPDGLVSSASTHPFDETLRRLERALADRGLTVFARFDHAGGAAAAGLTLRPTFVLAFGNPAAGTPLMQADQRVGLDLPLRMLVWQDEAGAVHLGWTDPAWLGRLHGLDATHASRLAAMAQLLRAIAEEAGGTA